jgi:acylphosphatase
MEEIRIVVYGKVQDVCFRLNTRRKALELGISGRVWNRKDGTVEVIAQGNPENLKKLLEWTNVGEGGAVVDKVEFKYRKIEKSYEDFLILRLSKALIETLIETTTKEIPTTKARA